MSVELWREFPLNNNYLVSNFGRVKSTFRNKVLKELNGKFYNKYCLQGKWFDCHRVVALTWVDNPDGKPQVNHKDGNRKNNHPNNLEWVTPSENILHAIESGAIKLKLTREQILEIRNSKENQYELAKRFGIAQSYVSEIQLNKIHKQY
ncbi:HNH endonuclease [Staphylococcus phage MVC_VPHSA2]|uniref:HNH endonuclease n=1 Tax=Staphylococcus phage MVC_VPHSA1 TaxID=3088876 RepID=A0ABZ0QYP3_9CAUD|nr:HNH endonuclease [Staphylococcus phage MVC_VPHSA1]WPF65027.1 HNH endonuclease [Staphylococcus phage MVC_VPHSA2]